MSEDRDFGPEDRDFVPEEGGLKRLWTELGDRYEAVALLGRGGTATVHRARDLKHRRDVAIKVLDPELGVTIGADRFHQEIAIEASLQHPNILTLLDSGQVGPFLYYVMPLAEGGSLADRLRSEGPLAIDQAVDIARTVAQALRHAHAQGVVHRDIKPANILFSAGHPMLADFGIAQAMSDGEDERLTDSGVSIGTPTYMSPEQASSSKPVDRRADIYSLGCVLYEMLVGEPPFTGPNSRVIFARQISERPPSVQIARPDVPDGLAQTVGRMLSKEAADRHRDVDELLADLEGRATTWQRRRSSRRLGIAAVVVAAALATLYLIRGGDVLSPDKIAVFPLVSRGVGSVAELDGVGVAYLIEAALEHADPLRLIDVTPRLSAAELADPSRIGAAAARATAREHGAAFYLTGVIQGHSDSTTVMLRLHDSRGDSLVEQASSTGGFGVPLHHLGIDALLKLLPSLIQPGGEVELGALRDRNPDAVALWWQGERAYRQSDFEMALDLYQRALVQDSALVLAAVKGAQAADWMHENERGRALVRNALQHEDLLPTRYAMLAQGLDAYFSGDADEAVALLEAAQSRYPEWSEASAALGEVYIHAIPHRRPLDSLARGALLRAAEKPGFSPPLVHLAEQRLLEGDLEMAERYIARLESAEASPAVMAYLSLMRQCVSSPRGMDWNAATDQNSLAVFQAAKTLSAGARQHACSEGGFRAILRDPRTSPGERWGAFLALQAILIATDRDLEASALIDSVSVRTGQARSLYVLGALAGGDMRHQAAGLDSFARERFGDDYRGVVNAESLWILYQWLVHAADRTGQDAILEVLTERASGTAATPQDAFFAEAARLHDAALLGRSLEEALAALPGPGRDALAWGFGASLAPQRLDLARRLLHEGRLVEAIRAAAVFDHGEPILFVQFVPASLQIRMEAARELGDREAASRYEARLRSLYRVDLIDPQSSQGGS